MLQRLYVRNYAIIDELDLSFSEGLTIITGETGAGKSILLGALGLALGGRADAKVVSSVDGKCIIEAYFSNKDESLKPIFEESDLEFEPITICRREVNGNGKSRAFINDTPVSLKVMQDVTSHYIELHQQHDNLALQSRNYQLDLLDAISKSHSLRNDYALRFKEVHSIENQLRDAIATESNAARRRDFLKFQMEELSAAKPVAGEMQKLEETQQLLEHANSIAESLEEAQHILYRSPHAVITQLTGLIKSISGVSEYLPSLRDLGQRLEQVRIEIQDIAQESERLDVPEQNDPNKLLQIQQRLSMLYSLSKKYNVRDDQELLELYNSIQSEWNMIDSIQDKISALEKEIQKGKNTLRIEGEKLSASRAKGIQQLIPGIVTLLKDLGMPNARFDITQTPLPQPSNNGLDDIQYTFSANRGASLQPIQSIASGGELSRLSLALKSMYAGQSAVNTIIFDEIDTGISGEVAWKMGQLLLALASHHQIIMITHSPQIASHAQTHLHVSKREVNERDISAITKLNESSRIDEIAKMLSGDPPTPTAKKNAKELIGKAIS